VPTPRLGMSAWVLVFGAIVTVVAAAYAGTPFVEGVPLPLLAWPFIVVLLFGLSAGYTKKPSFPWFSWPHRWLRRSGRSVLEIALVAAGIPATAGFVTGVFYSMTRSPVSAPVDAFLEELFRFPSTLLYIGIYFSIASLYFMSGAFLGNALRRRFGVIGTPKEPVPGQEDGDTEQEEVWTTTQEVRWGLIGTIGSAVLTGIFSVVVALIDK
jgi:hypothetical protein